MFSVLLQKEIREQIQTFRFAALLITLFGLTVLSVWVLGDDYVRRRDTYNKLAEQAAIQTRECKVPSLLQPVVHYPPSALGIFAKGEEKRLGNAVTIDRWAVPRDASDSLMDNELLAAQPSFDFLAILTVVASLFGVLLTYDSISGERERGTLKQLCSTTTGRGAIFTAKFVAGSLILLVPILISLLMMVLILQFFHNIAFTAMQWLSIALMVLSAFIYGAIFIALGILCSALVRRASISLILALLIWTISVILVPRIGSGLATTIHPLPSPSEVDSLKKVTEEETRRQAEDQERLIRSKTKDMGFWGTFSTTYRQPILRWGTPDAFRLFQEATRIAEPLWQRRAEVVWNLEKEHEAELVAQAELADWLSLVSPSSHLRRIFNTLSGTSYEYYSEFMEDARRFRRAFLDNLESKGYFGRNSLFFVTQIPMEVGLDPEKLNARLDAIRNNLGEGAGWEDVISEDNWDPLPSDIVPAFEFKGDQPQLELVLGPFSSLAVILTVLFLAGLFAFHRYDIR